MNTEMSTRDRPHVAVIEDEAFIVESLRFLLERNGMVVSAYTSGTAALANIAPATQPDVIILDLMIPGVDGMTVLQKFRTERNITAKIIVLTANGQDAERERALAAGADLFITKPYSNQDLIAKVMSLAP